MTTKIVKGRILDKEFEDQINSGIDDAHKQFDSNIDDARHYMEKKQSMIEDAVSKHPFEFVLGALVSGLILGTLISRK